MITIVTAKEPHLSRNLRGRFRDGGCCRASMGADGLPEGGHSMTTDMTSSASIPVAARIPGRLRGRNQ